MSIPDPLANRPIPDSLVGAHFVKVTGPAGDWIVFHDASTPALTKEQIVALCDRRSGVGATGIVVLSPADEKTEHVAARNRLTAWHADGSDVRDVTEPARAATSLLAATGVIDHNDTSHLTFQKDTSLVTTVYTPAYIGVDLGQWSYQHPETATTAGSDALVMTAGLPDPRPGLSIRIQHDHIIIAVETREELEGIDLSQEPSIEPVPDEQTTVGFVVPQDPLIVTGMGQLMMRSSAKIGDHTLASATAAASIAFQQWSGLEQLKVWKVHTPSGDIVVQLHDHNRISTFASVPPVFFGRF